MLELSLAEQTNNSWNGEFEFEFTQDELSKFSVWQCVKYKSLMEDTFEKQTNKEYIYFLFFKIKNWI